MQEHPNATRIRKMFQAFRDSDLPAINAMIPVDAVWHFPGRRGKLAGDHNGRDAIFAFLLNVQALTDGTFHLDLIDVLANDAHAVAFFRGHGTRNGKTLDNPTCLRMRLNQDGQVVEVWEFVWDLYHIDDFWA
ncbi:MAG TPA: nuclear transport factor 2 family protein [Candidatus Acidoferrales bacterium]|nr:nuclear transport factor 2 family protein [Candidatus Acidoferrales bacterium]